MIYLGSDHRGFHLKEKIKQWLKEWARLAEGEPRQDYEFEDLGNMVLEPDDDYPDFALVVGERVMREIGEEKENKGIVICGSGVGVDIVANKVKGVRCGLGFDSGQIKLAREHDNINCLALPADYLDGEQAKEIVKMFLETKFSEEEKYKRRIKKMEGGE